MMKILTAFANKVFEPFTCSINDSTDDVFVNVTHQGREGPYMIAWGNQSFRDTADLILMTEGRIAQLPPNFQFSNESFICISTAWTGPFWESLFLPLRKNLEYRFFKEDVEWIDSTRSQVCYIDPYPDPEKTGTSKTYWAYENLIGGYKKDFEIPIYENSCCYPWYSNIERQGNYLVIEPQGTYKQQVTIEIK